VKTLGSSTLALIASGQVALAQLVRLDFTSGTLAWNTSNYPITWSGVTYVGAAGLGTIQTVDDSPGEVKGMQFEISGVSSSNVSLALDGADEWQGTPVTILTALIDLTDLTKINVLDAEIEWSGIGDTMNLSEDGETCAVTATAESSAVDLLHGIPLTYTQADQQTLHPGDSAFMYVNQQADQPIVWPDRTYFQR
jgi:hypothetical protein